MEHKINHIINCQKSIVFLEDSDDLNIDIFPVDPNPLIIKMKTIISDVLKRIILKYKDMLFPPDRIEGLRNFFFEDEEKIKDENNKRRKRKLIKKDQKDSNELIQKASSNTKSPLKILNSSNKKNRLMNSNGSIPKPDSIEQTLNDLGIKILHKRHHPEKNSTCQKEEDKEESEQKSQIENTKYNFEGLKRKNEKDDIILSIKVSNIIKSAYPFSERKEKIFEFLSNVKTLYCLTLEDLTLNESNPDQVKLLTEIFQNISNLSKIKFKDIKFSFSSFSKMMQSMNKISLKTLSFLNCVCINCKEINTLVNSVSINKLSIVNSFSNEEINKLTNIDCLIESKSLSNLKINKCNIKDVDICAFRISLENNYFLKKLNLAHSYITENGMLEIFKCFQKNTELEEIILTESKISNVEDIQSVLENNISNRVKQLNLKID